MPPEGGLRAGEEARTPDIQLGRLTLYQLSYTREIDQIQARERARWYRGTPGNLTQIALSLS